jgi:hypothetical protein
MAFFIIMLPFVVTASLLAVTSAWISLFAGGAVALALVGVDLWRGRTVKILGAGSVVVFAGLGCYLGLIEREWSDFSVRLAIDVGMLAIALASIAIKMPFTMQYAREQVDAETIKEPGFLRVNYTLTWVWVGAMVLMLIADILMIYFPTLPLWVGLAALYAARNAAVYFTKWYSSRWIGKAHGNEEKV